MKEEVKDPVCGMEFAAEKAAATLVYEGRTYHFCTEACRREFERNPERYAEEAGAGGGSRS